MFFYGTSGAININTHFANFNKLGTIPNCCPKFRNTAELGWSLSFLLRKRIYENVELGLNFGVSNEGAEFVENEFIGNTAVKYVTKPSEVIIAPVFVDHHLKSKLYLIYLNPELILPITKNFWFAFGLNFSNFMLAKIDQNEIISSPSNIIFIDGKRTRNEYQDLDLPSLKSLQIRPTFSASYDFSFLDGGIIAPFFRVAIPLQNITSVEWKVMPLQFGLSVRFSVNQPPELHYYYDTLYLRDTTSVALLGLKEPRVSLVSTDIIKTEKIQTSDGYIYRTTISEKYRKEIPQIAKISTSFTVQGISRDGKTQDFPTLVIEEIETEEMFPLLPYIYFPTGEFLLTKTKMQILDKEQTNQFSEYNLEWNTLSIWENLLNIVGSRLKKNSKAGITLVGCNSNSGIETNNLELSRKRAEQVKNYLVEVWDIDPKRISIKYQNLPSMLTNPNIPEGKEENQRVEIYSNDFSILQPVRLREIQRKSNPPIIEIIPKVISDLQIEGWGITIEQNGQVLRSFSGTDVPEKVHWNVEEEPIPKLEAPIEVKFFASDILKQKESSKANIKIEQKTIRKKREVLKEDKKIEKFSLIVFDFDKVEIQPHQKPILNEIKLRIQPNSRVTITGFTDKIGEPTYNKNLALRRCLEVKKFLALPDSKVDVIPVGSDHLLYDNSLPQGRSYCRTVQIIIATPITK
ncbi:MAG: OmpA family protein [Candidatus Kapaibacteriales bacterium]